MTDNCRLPEFSIDEAAEIARRLFALQGPIRRLDGERDLNFLIGEPGARQVLKIANEQESPAMLECQHLVFERLAAAQAFPVTVTARRSVNGKTIETVYDGAGTGHSCRVLPFVEGRVLREIGSHSPALLADIGRCMARLDRALDSFHHPALERPLLWKMDGALEIVDNYASLLDGELRAAVSGFAERFRQRLLPRSAGLRRQVIHNDANRNNLVVDESASRLLSVIDFGDMVESWLAVEAALAATYVMLDRPAPLEAAAHLIGGYHDELPLEPAEQDSVFDFICMRLCMSLCIGAHQSALHPENAYLGTDLDAVRRLIVEFRAINPDDAREVLFPS